MFRFDPKLLKEFIAGDDRIVILGIGNIQKGDDAAGAICADSLIRKISKTIPSNIKIINGGVTPENFTGDIRRFKPTRVLIIDAVIAGLKPGTIFIVDPAKILNEDVSTHRMPLSMLCRFLEESIGCRVLIIGIEPEKVELDIPLSKIVQKSISVIVDFLASLLEPHK
jgi:hydrogenase 3 maturation protease